MKFRISAVICFLALCGAAHAEEMHVYDSLGRRDPFVPLLGVTARAAESLEDITDIEDVSLQGIATFGSGKKKIAILNGEMLKEGQTVGHITVEEILQYHIVLTIDGEKHRLSIHEEEKNE